jgi:integrase
MASISRDENGTKRVCFTAGDGERRAVRLGAASVKAAESFKLRIEALLADKATNKANDAELSAWLLRDLPERMHERLVRVGLVSARTRAEVVTLGALLDRFDAAAVVKAGTRTTYLQAMRMLREHFGDSTPLPAITPSDADRWRKAIAHAADGRPALASATVAKRVRVAKAVFRKAVRWGLIPANPFEELRAGSQSNPERAFYVAPESVRAILAACPDDQWRAIVALSRYAGLRCPSEVVALRWGGRELGTGAG